MCYKNKCISWLHLMKSHFQTFFLSSEACRADNRTKNPIPTGQTERMKEGEIHISTQFNENAVKINRVHSFRCFKLTTWVSTCWHAQTNIVLWHVGYMHMQATPYWFECLPNFRKLYKRAGYVHIQCMRVICVKRQQCHLASFQNTAQIMYQNGITFKIYCN